MTSKLATCILYCGFTQVPHDAGLGKLHNRLTQEHLWDRREFPFVALRPWNADVKTDAELTIRAGADFTAVIAFSYGAGEALTHYAAALHERQPGRVIDLAVLIDPVTRYRWLKWRALKHGGAYRVPDNVRNVAVIRTLNKPTLASPVGHDVVCGPDTKVVANVVYGSAKAIEDRHGLSDDGQGWGEQSVCGVAPQLITDPDLHHGNIDDSDEVHGRAIVLVERLIQGGLA